MRVKVETEEVPQPVKNVSVKDDRGNTVTKFTIDVVHDRYVVLVSAVHLNVKLSTGELTELIRGLTCLRNRLQEGDIK